MTEMQHKFFDKRIVGIENDITMDAFYYFKEVFARLSLLDEAPPIKIVISSNGGHADPALYIYDLIRLYPGQTTGLVTGFAKSMAAIILQACSVRQMTSNSYLLVHNVTTSEQVSVEDMRNQKKMDAIIKRIDNLDKKKIVALSKRTGQSEEFITKLMKENRHMDAEEALRLNFVDKII